MSYERAPTLLIAYCSCRRSWGYHKSFCMTCIVIFSPLWPWGPHLWQYFVCVAIYVIILCFLKKNKPTCGRGVGARWPLRSLPTQVILWFYKCLMWLKASLTFGLYTGSLSLRDLLAVCKTRRPFYLNFSTVVGCILFCSPDDTKSSWNLK